MDFDLARTALAFVVLIVLANGALIAAPVMSTNTILMMVLPSTVVFGLICLGLGVKHGEFRARAPER